MRITSSSLLALCLTVAAVPAMAQTLYNNGPIDGTTDAWNIKDLVVSDTFNLTANSSVTGFSFGAWLFPGDVLLSAELSITSAENGGTSYFDQTISFTQQGRCSTRQFDVCTETASFNGPSLSAGTYWLNLQHASTASHAAAYWDENSGPSLASVNDIGTVPSEAFTLYGQTARGSSSVPEPSSIMLLGSGILGLAGLLRRRLL